MTADIARKGINSRPLGRSRRSNKGGRSYLELGIDMELDSRPR